MKYENPALPTLVREQIEDAVTALVDHPKLPIYSRCRYNSEDHIALACKPFVGQAVDDFLFSDEAIEDREVLNLLGKKDQPERLYMHAAAWLAKALREKYPAEEV